MNQGLQRQIDMIRNRMKQMANKRRTKKTIHGRRIHVFIIATLQTNNNGLEKKYKVESMIFWPI
jgi:hypothetical protein